MLIHMENQELHEQRIAILIQEYNKWESTPPKFKRVLFFSISKRVSNRTFCLLGVSDEAINPRGSPFEVDVDDASDNNNSVL